MTKKCKFKKDIRQPSIVNVLKGHSADEPENNSVQESEDQEVSGICTKRRRDTSDSSESTTPNSNFVKKGKKIPRMASEGNSEDTALDATPLVPHGEESTQTLSINEISSPSKLDPNKKTSSIVETTIPLPPKKKKIQQGWMKWN